MTVPEPPSWIVAAGQQNESASQMIFGCDAVFADNISRGFVAPQSTVLGDLEDSISAAFNRGISDLAPSEWSDTTKWFPTNGTYNYWVEFRHQTGLTYGDLAYAFPFDDKFGASTNLNENTVGNVQITLGAWTSSTVPSTTTFSAFPSSGAQLQGPISLTAQVAASNTVAHPLNGTVSFFINGVAINSTDYSSSPPVEPVSVDSTSGQASISGKLPVMPDGNTPHTYVVTAVYSGDEYRAPSVAYQTLELTPAFSLGFGANPVALNEAFNLVVTLNTPTYSGTIDFSISYPDGSGAISLGSAPVTTTTISKSVTIPPTFLQFTGEIVTSGGTSSIQNVSDFSGLAPGQIVTGNGLPSNLTLGGPTPNQFTIQPASSVTGNVMLTVNGRTFAAYILPSNPTIVQNVDVISDLQITDKVSGIGITPGTTIQGVTKGSIPLNQVVSAATGVNFTSNGANAAFPITVTYKPTDGPSISTTANIGIEA
jgi:Beta-1,3-glucanase